MANSRERERGWRRARKKYRREKGGKGKSKVTRMPNKEDSNDNSVSFVSPRHSINDGGNKGRLMSLRSGGGSTDTIILKEK